MRRRTVREKHHSGDIPMYTHLRSGSRSGDVVRQVHVAAFALDAWTRGGGLGAIHGEAHARAVQPFRATLVAVPQADLGHVVRLSVRELHKPVPGVGRIMPASVRAVTRPHVAVVFLLLQRVAPNGTMAWHWSLLANKLPYGATPLPLHQSFGHTAFPLVRCDGAEGGA